MTAVRKILEDLDITDSVIAIGVAKGVDRDAGRERFFVKGKPDFTLPRAIPCSTSSSACATRHIVLRSGHTGHGARRRWSRTRWTKSAASARPASGRFCSTSGRRKPCRGRQSAT